MQEKYSAEKYQYNVSYDCREADARLEKLGKTVCSKWKP